MDKRELGEKKARLVRLDLWVQKVQGVCPVHRGEKVDLEPTVDREPLAHLARRVPRVK